NTATSSPARWVLNSASTGSAPRALSVTMRGRSRPCSRRCCATSLRAPAPQRMAVGKEKPLMVMMGITSDDLEIALQFPVGDTVQPLAPFPVPGGRKMFDEGVAQQIPRDPGVAEVARGFDQGSRCARDVLRALVGARDRRRGELEALLDTVQARRDHGRHGEGRIDVGAGAAR